MLRCYPRPTHKDNRDDVSAHPKSTKVTNRERQQTCRIDRCRLSNGIVLQRLHNTDMIDSPTSSPWTTPKVQSTQLPYGFSQVHINGESVVGKAHVWHAQLFFFSGRQHCISSVVLDVAAQTHEQGSPGLELACQHHAVLNTGK